jgi:hypothetical protein
MYGIDYVGCGADREADRRVLIRFDGAVGAGTAALQSPPGTIRCTITDRNTRNNTCACPVMPQ